MVGHGKPGRNNGPPYHGSTRTNHDARDRGRGKQRDAKHHRSQHQLKGQNNSKITERPPLEEKPVPASQTIDPRLDQLIGSIVQGETVNDGEERGRGGGDRMERDSGVIGEGQVTIRWEITWFRSET